MARQALRGVIAIVMVLVGGACGSSVPTVPLSYQAAARERALR
jgi:hypothetical protein